MRRTSRTFALSSMLGSLAFGLALWPRTGRGSTSPASGKVRFAAPIAAIGLLASGAAPADEASLTGIWEGILVCDDSQAGVPVNFVADDLVEITERDGNLRLRRVTQDGAESFLFYEGPVVALASSDRFEAMVSVCGGSYEAKETVRLRRVQVNEDGSGSFDAESLYESADAIEGVQIFGTCKWAYERVSTSNPRVPRC